MIATASSWWEILHDKVPKVDAVKAEAITLQHALAAAQSRHWCRYQYVLKPHGYVST